MIWYCHLLSTANFHRHLVDHNHTAFGLEHFHFPFTELIALIRKKKWSHSSTKSSWDKYNKDRSLLPYQLWEQPPWKGTGGTHDSAVSRLFRRSTLTTPEPSSDQTAAKKYGYSHEPIIRQSRELHTKCALSFKQEESPHWSLEDYTAWRLGQRDDKCRAYHTHLRNHERCELSPFPSIDDLSVALYGKAAFWTALVQARDTQSDFLVNLQTADADYVQFMSLFRRKNMGTVHVPIWEVLECVRLVPLTLEIDLLWHTHRLFPGCYWSWCVSEVGQLVDYDYLPSRDCAKERLEATKARWDTVNMGVKRPIRGEVTDWMGVYIPDAAVLASDNTLKGTLESALKGRDPWRKGRRPKVQYKSTGRRSGNRNYGDSGGSSGGGGYDTGYAGGGDSGGGGGGGDGGGGGGGDGGGC